MLKKIMILALGVMALAAVAAPLASANWTHKGVKIPAGTNPVIQFTGQSSTISSIGSIDCQTKFTVQFTGGQTTGHVNTFEIDLTQAGSTPTTKCVTGGPLANCKVTSLQSTQLPWLIHSDGGDKITITTGQIHYKLEGSLGHPQKCAFLQEITYEPPAVPPLHELPTANIPGGQTSAITQVSLQGRLTTSIGTQITIGGSQTIQAPNNNTYGTA